MREVCDHCGKSLDDMHHNAKFCSVKCQQDFRNNKRRDEKLAAKGPCLYCGTKLRSKQTRYCSRRCKSLGRRASMYGMTPTELFILLSEHPVCDVCGTGKWGPKGPQVDHDHDMGHVRGVLCMNCNTMIGQAQDDPKHLRLAADYLESK